MNEIREIVTKAVVGKGKKLIRLQNNIVPDKNSNKIKLLPINKVYGIM